MTKRCQFAETYYNDSQLGGRINTQLFDEKYPNCTVVHIIALTHNNYITVIFECDEVEEEDEDEEEQEGSESEGDEDSSAQEDS